MLVAAACCVTDRRSNAADDDDDDDDSSKKRPKIVTLDGTVIHSSGNMTGGTYLYSSNMKMLAVYLLVCFFPAGVGASERLDRWDEKEVAKLRVTREAYMKESVELDRERRSSDLEQQSSVQVGFVFFVVVMFFFSFFFFLFFVFVMCC